jgi:hypothetical protein
MAEKSEKGSRRDARRAGTLPTRATPNSLDWARAILSAQSKSPEAGQLAIEHVKLGVSRRTFRRIMSYVRSHQRALAFIERAGTADWTDG